LISGESAELSKPTGSVGMMANPADGAEFQNGKEDDRNGLSGGKASVVSDKYDPETLEIDHVAEKKLVRKLDLYIVPMVMLLYLLVRTL
jgi:hypothetical protein